jgi:hypothetical protein
VLSSSAEELARRSTIEGRLRALACGTHREPTSPSPASQRGWFSFRHTRCEPPGAASFPSGASRGAAARPGPRIRTPGAVGFFERHGDSNPRGREQRHPAPSPVRSARDPPPRPFFSWVRSSSAEDLARTSTIEDRPRASAFGKRREAARSRRLLGVFFLRHARYKPPAV